ncbi:MAG: four helix bundle protein [Balneolaceae bacterium]
MRDFHKLSVWKKAHQLTLGIYHSTNQFPNEKRYGLMSQMRPIPSNIAEGCGRNSQAQFARFLNIAFGSASELEYQIILSKDPGFINNNKSKELNDNITEIKRMLFSLIQKYKLTADN